MTTGLTSQPWKNTEDFSHFGKVINRFINTFMHRVLCEHQFSFFLFKLKEWISGLYDKTLLIDATQIWTGYSECKSTCFESPMN